MINRSRRAPAAGAVTKLAGVIRQNMLSAFARRRYIIMTAVAGCSNGCVVYACVAPAGGVMAGVALRSGLYVAN